MTNAKSTKGTRLAVLIDDVWHFFPELKSVPEIGESAEKIEATNFDSEIKEYVKGTPDYSADLEFTMSATPAGTSGSNLDLIDQLNGDEVYTFLIQYPQLGIQFTLMGEFTSKMGPAEQEAVQDVVLTIIPRSKANRQLITSKFSVTYDSNQGTGTMTDSSSPYANGSTVTVMENTFTAPEGKTFLCWNTRADNSGTPYDEGDEFTIYSNVTLYAIWSVAA